MPEHELENFTKWMQDLGVADSALGERAQSSKSRVAVQGNTASSIEAGGKTKSEDGEDGNVELVAENGDSHRKTLGAKWLGKRKR